MTGNEIDVQELEADLKLFWESIFKACRTYVQDVNLGKKELRGSLLKEAISCGKICREFS